MTFNTAAVDTSSSSSPLFARLSHRLIQAGLVLTPLAFLPMGVLFENALDLPRRLCMTLISGLLLTIILFTWARRGTPYWRRQVLDLPVLCVFAAVLLSGILGAYPLLSFVGSLYVPDATLIAGTGQLLILGLLFYFGVRARYGRVSEVTSAVVLLGCIGGLEAGIGLIDRFHPLGLSPFSGLRLAGTLGNSMFTGTYLAMLIPLSLCAALATQGARRVLLLISAGVMLPAVLFTLARAAWVGLVVALSLLALLLILRRTVLRHEPNIRRTLFIAGGIGLGLLLLAVLHAGVRSRLATFTTRGDETRQTRMVFMRGALAMFTARPLQGWGPGTFPYLFPQYRASSTVRESGTSLNQGHSTALPHNLPLQIAAEMGLLGLLPLCCLVVLLYRIGYRLLSRDLSTAWLALGLLGCCTAYLCTNLLAYDNAATTVTFWAAVALLAGLDAGAPALRPAVAQPPHRACTCICGATGVVVLFGTVVFVVTQAVSAYYIQHGVVQTAQAYEQRTQDAALARQTSVAAVSNIKRGLAWIPLPDYVGYDALCIAEQAAGDLANDPQSAEQAYAEELRAGQRALALMDRDVKILFLLAMFHTERSQWAEADALFTRLLIVEPNSAEHHLFYARMLERAGDLVKAETQAGIANGLDPALGQADALLAHILFQQWLHHDIRGGSLLSDVIDHYTHAEQHGFTLPSGYRFEYASALFLTSQNAQGVTQGRLLRGTPEFTLLCQRLEFLYQRIKRQEEGQQLIQQMQ